MIKYQGCGGMSTGNFGNVCPSQSVEFALPLEGSRNDAGDFVADDVALAPNENARVIRFEHPLAELDGIAVSQGLVTDLESIFFRFHGVTLTEFRAVSTIILSYRPHILVYNSI